MEFKASMIRVINMNLNLKKKITITFFHEKIKKKKKKQNIIVHFGYERVFFIHSMRKMGTKEGNCFCLVLI